MIPKPIAAIAFGSFLAVAQSAAAQMVPPAPAPELLPVPDAKISTYPALEPGDHLSSDIIGQTVYAGMTENAGTIGDINDLIVTEDGMVLAAVIDVGPFLGVDEKNVAVDFTSLDWQTDDNGKPFVVLSTTPDELQSAPAFEVAAFEAPAAIPPQSPMPLPPPAGEQGLLNYPNVAQAPAAEPLPPPAAPSPAFTVSANNLLGTGVMSADNESVGTINDVLLTNDGRIDAVVVDVGGFLGIGAKPVAIAFEALDIRSDENKNLLAFVDFTKSELELAPGYSEPDYDSQRDTMRLASRA